MNMQLKNISGDVIVRKESLMKLELGWAEVGLRIRLIECESSVASDSGHWFCLSVMTGREEAVEKALDEFGIKALVPMRKCAPIRRRHRIIEGLMVPVMRGYVLVNMPAKDPSFLGIKGLKHVIDVVGGSLTPMLISEKSVDEFKAKADDGKYDHRDNIKISYKAGNMVRIIDGPFAGFPAVVQKIDKTNSRIAVETMLFGRATIVELCIDQIEMM